MWVVSNNLINNVGRVVYLGGKCSLSMMRTFGRWGGEEEMFMVFDFREFDAIKGLQLIELG